VFRPRYPYPALTLIAISTTNTAPGGWDDTGAIPTSLTAEIEQAFANVDACLRSAGAAGGWAQVYKVNLYTTELSEEAFAAWAASIKKWAGEDHRPLLTGVGVSGLGVPGMRVEIEVVAHVPAGEEAS
jgi:enamine deaminase RidA (YjgF/YER057c/UK114 family)